MPKSYSENERIQIIKSLQEETKKLLSQFGVKKTSVDEIVRRVNIPKGTFYLFYESKELLLFDVITEEQDAIQAELLDTVGKYNGTITKEQFSEIIFTLYKSTTNSFLYALVTNGEMEILMRKLPQEAVEKHIKQDDTYIKKLFSLMPQAGEKNINTFSGALRSIFLMAMHKKEIGEAVFNDTIKLLIDGLTEMLFKEEI